jgi:hypothetical protein
MFPIVSPPLPPATEVAKRHRVVIGGEAAIKKHTTHTITGSFEIAAQGMKGDLTIVGEAPNRTVLSISLPGLGDLKRG